jgi:hypothetical protein
MIDKVLLQQNAALAGLTDAQLDAIVTIASNDLNTEIGHKFSEVYRQLDTTIEKSTDIAREGDEKTYKYLERAITKMKESLDSSGLQSQIDTLKAEKTRLEEQVAKGGDEETKRLLASTKAELENAKTEYGKLQTQMEKFKTDHKKELLGLQVTSDVKQAAAGLSFKKEIPQTVVDTMVQQAVARLAGTNPEYIDNGQGGKRLVFRGEDGAIKNNPKNQLNPYTAGELLSEYLSDIIAPAASGGAGTNRTDPKGGSATDISGAKTRVQAQEIIAKSLADQGLAVGTQAYQEAMDKAWKDNNVSNLPLQ